MLQKIGSYEVNDEKGYNESSNFWDLLSCLIAVGG